MSKRGGRKRIAGQRTTSGRLSRKKSEVQRRTREQEQSAVSVGLEARKRLHSLDEKQARDPMAGTVVGRLVLMKMISADQYQAAERYLEVKAAYQRSIDAKPMHNEPPPEIGGNSGYEVFCERAKAAHDGMNAALRELMMEARSPASSSALDVIVLRDVECPELVADLRAALNCLYRHFFTGQSRAAA